MIEKILWCVFLGICASYSIYKLLEFIAKKIFGGRTAQEKSEEKYLRRRHIEEPVSSIPDTIAL